MIGKDLFRTAAADFDHPLEMLGVCHDRIEERCALLQRLCQHIRESGVDAQARQAAENVMRYFDTAGENHHLDEEEDLFPRLIEADREACEALIVRLRQEHGRMRERWIALRAQLAQIAAGESTAALEEDEVERFTTLYRGHIDLEERQLLPAAQRLLGASALASAGDAMARRRGVRR
jgi:hemerythrin-like domain-containing protein